MAFCWDYFSIGKVNSLIKKPMIPGRLSVLLLLKLYKKQILSIGVKSAFIEAPEGMIAVSNWGLRLCYKFSGVENPLPMSRYPFGRLFANPFEKMLFSALANHAELILAAADRNAIKKMASRSKGILDEAKIVHYPTRVDTKIFNAKRKTLSGFQPVFLSCGRLIRRVKGWDLILDAFRLVKDELPLVTTLFCSVMEEDRKSWKFRLQRLLCSMP